MWRILVEIVFVLALALAGGPFWSCLKAPAHLRKLLADPGQLERIVNLIGFEKLCTDAQGIKAHLFGNYGDTILVWDMAHHKSLSKTRNMLGVIVGTIFAASWWLGSWYFLVSLFIFIWLGFSELPAVVKNSNAEHLPSVILNPSNGIKKTHRLARPSASNTQNTETSINF